MSPGLFVVLLTLGIFHSTNADFVVYPSNRTDLPANSLVTHNLNWMLGPSNVVPYVSNIRQLYEFWLVTCTSQQAQRIAAISGVEAVIGERVIVVEEGELVSDPTLEVDYNSTVSNGTNGLLSPKPAIVRQKDAPQDLDLVSWPPQKTWVKSMPGYDYEVGAGVDTYIYVIDNGVNIRNPDFAKMPYQAIEWHYAPSVSKIQTDDSVTGHGSCVASKATGWTNGVSKNSHLVMIKAGLTIADTHFAFATALDDILTKDRKRKAVLLFPRSSTDKFSQASPTPKNWAAIRALINDFFAADIPVIVPAGNGARTAAPNEINSVPALWGIVSSAQAAVSPFPLIVAGAVTNRGLFAPFSQGRLNRYQLAWAPGDGVRCARRDGVRGDVWASGTSFSAGMVAGLVAYKITGVDYAAGTWAANMRRLIRSPDSSRIICPFNGSEVIWNGVSGKLNLDQNNISVS